MTKLQAMSSCRRCVHSPVASSSSTGHLFRPSSSAIPSGRSQEAAQRRAHAYHMAGVPCYRLLGSARTRATSRRRHHGRLPCISLTTMQPNPPVGVPIRRRHHSTHTRPAGSRQAHFVLMHPSPCGGLAPDSRSLRPSEGREGYAATEVLVLSHSHTGATFPSAASSTREP